MDSTDGQKRPPQPHCQPQGILRGFSHQLFPSFPGFYMEEAIGGCAPCTNGITPIIQTPSLLAYLARLANQVQSLWSPMPAVRVLGDEMGFKWDEESET